MKQQRLLDKTRKKNEPKDKDKLTTLWRRAHGWIECHLARKLKCLKDFPSALDSLGSI
jgi:hypothetical protein